MAAPLYHIISTSGPISLGLSLCLCTSGTYPSVYASVFHPLTSSASGVMTNFGISRQGVNVAGDSGHSVGCQLRDDGLGLRAGGVEGA